MTGEWGAKLAEIKALSDIAPWRLAVVLETGDQSARDRPAARARAGRRGQQGARDRHHPARRREVGEVRERPDARARRRPRSRRCWRSATSSMSSRSPARTASSACARCPEVSGAHRRDGSADRPRARDGRRLLLRPEPVQPRHPGAAPARLVVQAAGLRRRARQRLHALDRRARRAARDRHRLGHLGAGKLHRANSTGPRRCASASSSRATS